MTRALAFACLLVPIAARADVSAKAPPKDEVAESVLGRMLEILGSVAEGDAASPVKAPQGVRNFSGTNTVVRAALAYGVLRAGGFSVSQGWANTPELIGSAMAFFDEQNQKNLEASFRKLFGKTLVKSRSSTGDDTRYAYDPAALEAAFNRLYVKPDGTVGGVRAQTVYDTLLKKWVAERAGTVAAVLDRKGFVAQAARDFKTLKGDGLSWQMKLCDKLPEPLQREHRLVGTLVRRHADGTLPVVLKALRQVLRDYDPKTLEKLDARLRPPAA